MLDGALSPTESEKRQYLYGFSSEKFSHELAIKKYKTRLLNSYKGNEFESLIKAVSGVGEVFIITNSGDSTPFSDALVDFLNYVIRERKRA